jgi:hypothetical protein
VRHAGFNEDVAAGLPPLGATLPRVGLAEDLLDVLQEIRRANRAALPDPHQLLRLLPGLAGGELEDR